LEAVYNMQVFHLSTQGMLSVVLMNATAMRDILTLDLKFERQTVVDLQQEIVVGDRPRGPLKQWGNPHLNSCIKVN
jgi:hypothetical protein